MVLIRKYPPFTYAILIIVIGLCARAALLEHTDLIDPTESRYAWIAQHMVSSGDWLTPRLPMPEGNIPYLGKPPLHFWLTAISYSLFGVDEWSARLPSFIATLGILGAVILFGIATVGRTTATAGALIFFSAAMPFFLAGASVTDVTLTCLTTISTALLYLFASQPNSRRSLCLWAAVVSALGFLCKGPVSLVLTGLPIVMWSAFRRDFSWIRRFPWVYATALFTIVVGPWFALNEYHNPGFIKYFIWNENIARYLFKDYGDKYGAGHVRPYGMAWVMLIAAFFPWTLVLGYQLYRRGWSGIKLLLQSRPHFLFVTFWAIATPLFFTFVRQLHPMYILPAMPALSLLTAMLFIPSEERRPQSSTSCPLGSRMFLITMIGIASILIIAGIVVGGSAHSGELSTLIAVLTIGLYAALRSASDQEQTVARAAAALFAIYVVGAVAFTPMINQQRSAELVLHAIAGGKDCHSPTTPHTVGLHSSNTFSHYWAASAWRTELGEELELKYVKPEDAASSGVCHYLLKAKMADKAPQSLRDNFDLLGRYGGLLLYIRKENPAQVSTP